jgi:hypothetical protein
MKSNDDQAWETENRNTEESQSISVTVFETMSAPGNPPVAASAVNAGPNEEDLRRELGYTFQSLKSREPLEPTYKKLLMNGVVTPRLPVLPKDKFYKRVGSRLRERVENFLVETQGKDPFDRIAQRQPLEEGAMRAALTMREAKEHEQQALLDATLAALPRRHGMDDLTRRRHLEAIAQGLQSREKKVAPADPTTQSVAQQTEHARQQAELERRQSQASAREAARRRREEEERQRREDEVQRKKRLVETPVHALHKIYQPIFKKLWDMEFAYLGGINPFRIVIDRDNCTSVGAPDYFDVIDTPMNLSYIQTKVDRMEYESLSAFFADVDLMIKNALKYNSDPSNPYRVAAEDLKKRYIKMVKKVMQTIKQNK